MAEKLALYGFNNLTKTLSYNIYDICYAKTRKDHEEYIEYIDEQYNSERLTNILVEVSDMIGAKVLNISKQDYDPQGASVDLLIANHGMATELIDLSNNLGLIEHSAKSKRLSKIQRKFIEEMSKYDDEILGHLDKSHITVHTFPEYHPRHEISTFRVDIEVATCGMISPLNTLDFLIASFDSDIMTIDYRVRGYTRDEDGKKIFIDHEIASIQDYIGEETLALYDTTDVNVEQSNIFHSKLMISDIQLENYVFGQDAHAMSEDEQKRIKTLLRQEMVEIYSGSNLFGG